MQVDVRDLGSITGSGRSPGGGHSNPLQYSDRGAWWAMVHRVAEVLGPGLSILLINMWSLSVNKKVCRLYWFAEKNKGLK